MTAGPSIDLSGWLDEQLAQASPVLRGMVKTFAEALMGAEADAICGRRTANAATNESISATATATGCGTPAPARSSWRSRSCARAAISRTGCWRGSAAPSRR
jgi:hypothetical protein